MRQLNLQSWWDPYLESASAIAWAAHESKDAARQVVEEAVSCLDVSTNISRKTLDDQVKKFREKTSPVFFGPPLLQRSLYIASDSKARKEGSKEAFQSEARLHVRYLQHLILLCLRPHRTSRWAALGIGELVFSYKGVWVGDQMLPVVFGEIAWDASARRRTKANLMDALEERFRFSSLTRIEAIGSEAEHFKACETQARFEAFLRDCLTLFIPWGTSHVLDEDFDPKKDTVGPLQPKPRTTKEETDPVELNRYHVFIDPVCFTRLVVKLGFPNPAKMIRLPQIARFEDTGGDFMSIDPPDGPPADPTRFRPLDPQDLQQVRKSLAHQAHRRRVSTGEEFTVCVDGVTIGTLRAGDKRIHFTLPLNADVIQVYGCDSDGQLLLATHFLCYSDEGIVAPSSGEVKLPPTRKFSFRVAMEPADRNNAVCDLSYAASTGFRALLDSTLSKIDPQESRGQAAWTWASSQFTDASESGTGMNKRVITSWRRRIAAMRVFHFLALGSGVIGAILTLVGSVRDVGPAGKGEIVVAIVLFATIGFLCFNLWRLARYCDRDLDESQLSSSDFPVQNHITERIQSLLGNHQLRVYFHRLQVKDSARTRRGIDGGRARFKDHGLAQVVRSPRGLHILLDVNKLKDLDSGNNAMPITCGLVWHEIGHYLQWDTSLGLWTLRMSQVMGRLSLFVGSAAVLGSTYIIVNFVRASKLAALPFDLLLPFLVILSATAYMLAVFFGVRFWCRFSEYNSDLTGVVEGYGTELLQLLKNMRSKGGVIHALLSYHPTAVERAHRIEYFLGQSPDEPIGRSRNEPLAEPGSLRLRVSDYIYGGLLYVASIFFGFQIGAIILIMVARHWGIVR